MELLEYLADKVGCTYMSDLRFLPQKPAVFSFSGRDTVGELFRKRLAGGSYVPVSAAGRFDCPSTPETDMPNVDVIYECTEAKSYKLKLKTQITTRIQPDVFFNWSSGIMKSQFGSSPGRPHDGRYQVQNPSHYSGQFYL